MPAPRRSSFAGASRRATRFASTDSCASAATARRFLVAAEHPAAYAPDALQAHGTQMAQHVLRTPLQLLAERLRQQHRGRTRDVDEPAREIDGRAEEVAVPGEGGSASEADAHV